MNLIDEQATEALGAAIAERLRPGDVITLSGPLGVGKTALARGLLAALGHAGEVPSPSFAIVQPYDEVEPPVWHVDLFRIDSLGELDELGLDAASDGVLLVEARVQVAFVSGGRARPIPKPLRIAMKADQEAGGGA